MEHFHLQSSYFVIFFTILHAAYVSRLDLQIYSFDIHFNIFFPLQKRMTRSLRMPGCCRCLLEWMRTGGSWPSTSNNTSHEPRKPSTAQWVKSVKRFLARKLKILPSCIITKTMRLHFVSDRANLTNVSKWRKLSATHHWTTAGHWWKFLINSVDSATKIQLEN